MSLKSMQFNLKPKLNRKNSQSLSNSYDSEPYGLAPIEDESHFSDGPIQTELFSSTDGIFARELVHDLRTVLTQARTGNTFSEHVISFVKEVAELQDQFANRLAKIVDRQMVKFAVHDSTDGLHGIREVWLRTVEESRAWATSSKQMSVNMIRMVEPLRRSHQASTTKLQQIIEENDRLSRPLLDQQTSIVRKQLRSNKVTMPMLHPSFRTLPAKKRDKIVAKARVEVVKYLNEVNRVNRWIMDVTTIARPKMLNALQLMEQDRIQRTLYVLTQYANQVQETSSTVADIATNIKSRLGDYQMENDLEQFVQTIASRTQLDREYLAPFPYRLPVTLRDLNIDESIIETPVPEQARRITSGIHTLSLNEDEDSYDGFD